MSQTKKNSAVYPLVYIANAFETTSIISEHDVGDENENCTNSIDNVDNVDNTDNSLSELHCIVRKVVRKGLVTYSELVKTVNTDNIQERAAKCDLAGAREIYLNYILAIANCRHQLIYGGYGLLIYSKSGIKKLNAREFKDARKEKRFDHMEDDAVSLVCLCSVMKRVEQLVKERIGC